MTFVKNHITHNKGKRKPLIYELPYGIKVISENHKTKYVMCYLEAHELFPNSKISLQGRQYVQRSRVIMTSILGRVLARNEHIHHINKEEYHNDDPSNLELLSSIDHNKHHHIGLKHTEEIKIQIRQSLLLAYAKGRSRRNKSDLQHDEFGRFKCHS